MKANNLKQKLSNGKKLLVDDMFYSLQCEGPFTGKPAYFIRLFGCNLNCSFCDQPQEHKPSKVSITELVKRVDQENASHLVVITGGEPMIQNVVPLVNALIEHKFTVQFETNGTLDVPDMPYESKQLFMVISPKTKKLAKQVCANALAFKYIIKKGKQNTKDGLPKGIYRPKEQSRVMVSPMFEEEHGDTEQNIISAVNISKMFGYYFSLQYHKYIDIE